VEYLQNDVIFYSQNKYVKNGYLLPNSLYTLYASHLICREINWEKHMWRLQFLRNKGCILNTDLFYTLYKQWGEMFGKNKRSNLAMTAEEFFDNALKFPVEHDELHKILIQHSYFEGQLVPTYEFIIKDGAEVEVCEEKFNMLNYRQKCNLVYEEVMNMAIERWPNDDYRYSYSKMLKKFILGHCPLWEGIFILENYVTLHKAPFNFKKHFENYGIGNFKEILNLNRL
jgi:hypothetical protein